MEEIPPELDGFEVERRLYTAESLNNLHKMHVCADLQQLMTGGSHRPAATPRAAV